MPYPKRGSATLNTIKLTFDFDTLDRLKAEAAARKVSSDRCAYEIIQEWLGLRASRVMGAASSEPVDEVSAQVQRGLDAMRNFRQPPR